MWRVVAQDAADLHPMERDVRVQSVLLEREVFHHAFSLAVILIKPMYCSAAAFNNTWP